MALLNAVKRGSTWVVSGATALVAGSALATETGGAIDTSGLESTISGAMTPVGAVGLAVLAVLAGIMVFKLIRRVM